jgi:hypothetical protein
LWIRAGFNEVPDSCSSGYGSRGCKAKNSEVLLLTKNSQFLNQKCNIFIPRLHEERPNYRRSLQSSKENIQYFKPVLFLIISFLCASFLSTWIQIRNQPTKINAVPNPQQTKGISFYPTNSSFNLEKFLAPSLPQLMIITRRSLASYGGNL